MVFPPPLISIMKLKFTNTKQKKTKFLPAKSPHKTHETVVFGFFFFFFFFFWTQVFVFSQSLLKVT